MRTRMSTVAKVYAMGSLWFAAMLGTAAVAYAALTPSYLDLGVSPELATLATMSLAVAMATAVVRFSWLRLGLTLRPVTVDGRVESAPDAALASIR